jgi:4-amino-4-deoxy-L-arabinose transferase-like glycosyltransferase
MGIRKHAVPPAQDERRMTEDEHGATGLRLSSSVIHRVKNAPVWLWLLILFVIALAPRALALGSYVTPDEPNWVFRTLNFGAALARGDWAATAQTSHPGVTTMWLGSLGIAAQRVVEPARTAEAIGWLSKIDHLSPENVEAFKRIGVFLDWARLPVIVVNALGVAGVFLLARRAFNQTTALVAAFLLALDPFVAGLQGLLHVDGLLTTFTILSLLSLLIATARPQSAQANSHPAFFIPHPSSLILHPSSFACFALSGALAGLALLSKSPALFLLPFTLLVVLAAVLARRLSARQAFLGLVVFFILHFAVFIVLYPAMWTDAASALGSMFEGAAYHAATATRPTFFDGQAELNHGFAYYPLALAFRLSPVTLLGLILAAYFLVTRNRHSHIHQLTLQTLTLLLFSVLFILFLSPAAKKFDRYLLPAIASLIIVGAWGISRLAEQRTIRSTLLLAPAAIIVQAGLMLSVSPYPLMAYSPLLGGAAGARDRIAVGWGEGLGAAAQWMTDTTPDATIAAGGLANLAPLNTGRVVTIDEAGLAAADYVVFTVSEAQLAPAFFDSLAQRGSLAHTISSGSIELAWVYTNDRPAEHAEWLREHARPEDAILLDAPTPLLRLLDPDSMRVLPLNAAPELISATLNDLRGYAHILHVSTEAASPVVRRDVRAWLESNAQAESETRLSGASVRIYAPNRQAASALDPFVIQLDGALALIGLQPLSDTAAYPDRVAVAARWLTLAPPPSDYAVTLELTDAGGNGWVKFGGPLRSASDFAPADWMPGEAVEQAYSVQVPPWLAPGDYGLRFSVDRADGSRAGLVSVSGAFSGTAPVLAAVAIEPGRQLAGEDAVPDVQRIHHAWPNKIELVGVGLLSPAVAGGDLLLATAYWRSLRDGIEAAREVQWTLQPEFASDADPFEWRTLIAPHTRSALREGQLIAARYAERLPLDLPEGRYRLRVALDGVAIDVAAVEITHRERKFDAPPGAIGIGTVGPFGVALIDPLPAQVSPGESIVVRLAVQSRRDVRVNYTIFAHLVDAQDRVVAQVDAWPQGGAWPTADWAPGQVVEDVYELSVPSNAPDGEYRIAVGMYNALDGARLLTDTGTDRLLVPVSIQVVAEP